MLISGNRGDEIVSCLREACEWNRGNVAPSGNLEWPFLIGPGGLFDDADKEFAGMEEVIRCGDPLC